MRAIEKIGLKAVRLVNGLVNMLLLTALLLLLVFGCYALWDTHQVYNVADAAQYEIYKPTAEEDGGESFAELKSINPEVFAWLTVYGTNIDYPVVQGQSNMKYLNKDAKGRHSLSGSIFLDADCDKHFSEFSSILHGHHMDRPAMFGEIVNFYERDYFDARKYGTLYYDGQEHGLEFFAFLHTDAYDGSVYRTKITGRGNQQAYLETLLQKAIHIRRDVQVTADDQIVLLTTCSGRTTNGRDILVGKLSDDIHDDPFKTETTDKPNNQDQIDGLPGLWAQTPLWAKISIIALPFLLILLLAVLTYTKRKRTHRDAAAFQSEGDE